MEEGMCPPLPSPELDNFSLHFASMYHSIFPPLLSYSPSPSSSADDDLIHPPTDDLLFQARLVLEHRELCQSLRRVTHDANCLRRENAELRLANAQMVKVLSSKTAVDDDLVAIPNSHLRGVGQNGEEVGNYEIISPTSVIGKYNNQFDGRNYRRRFSLPKTISVRSPPAPLNIQSRRVCAPVSGGKSGKKDQEEAMELEVYNQGMAKTELCNKWRDTGACPYGDHCRFSHGLEELRPVMRHPRYKTEMCRMILTGEKCPYGHRCHFRHSLTER